MIAVVLVPLVVLVAACLLERLEARVAPRSPSSAPLAPRRITSGIVGAEVVPLAAPAPVRRGHLRALPPVPVDAARHAVTTVVDPAARLRPAS